MRTVWKRKVQVVDWQDVEVPRGAEFLCAAAQGDDVCVWFLCDPGAPMETRRLRICGTGHPVEETGLRYVGTAHLSLGLVFHVFET